MHTRHGELKVQIKLREFIEEDIDLVCDYWYRSPAGFLESMGIIPKNIRSEDEQRNFLKSSLKNDTPLKEKKGDQLVILVDNKAVGIHPINQLTYGESGVLHAHIWFPEYRKKGIGSKSYLLAMQSYFEKFNLKSICFETPRINKGPNKLKEKLGIKPTGIKILKDHPFLQPNLEVILSEVSREWFEKHLMPM